MRKNVAAGSLMRILLVEYNHAHAEMVKRNFADNSLRNVLDHVDDGEKAMDYLHKRGAYADLGEDSTPHLVLLDLRLPKVDGLDVLETIKTTESLKRIPVVILTTSRAESDVTSAYQRRANSYLVKPMDFDKYTTMMDEMSRYWLGWNHTAY